MKILITGATGLVGTRLVEKLLDLGYSDINILGRDKTRAQKNFLHPVKFFEWDLATEKMDKEALIDVDIVFNLAGENIADGRWSAAKKERILNSRIKAPKVLWKHFRELGHFPKKFISSSAVGIYGDHYGKEITLNTPLPNNEDDFLAQVCKKWEEAVHENAPSETKCYGLRTGVVLSPRGGALAKMLPAFKAGVAGRLGSGKQYMSWIHLDDLVSQFIFIMENEVQTPILNGVSPHAVNNIEFTKTLGDVLNRPTLFPVPAMALRLLFGEMSSVLLLGQNVFPEEWQELGFKYQYPSLRDALENLLKEDLAGERELLRYQYIPRPVDSVFEFFSRAANLEEITPNSLSFKIVNQSTPSVQSGTIINYKLKVHGIPMKWKTEILDYKENEHFIDDQVSGPYKKWFHRHHFIKAKDGGTIIRDQVTYKLPLGLLGSIIAGPFVKRDVHNIFKYRFNSVNQIFKA